MSKANFFKRLSPANLADAIERRGVAGTAVHAVRRLGTVMEHSLVGPSLIRINPMGFVCNHTCPMCWLQHLDGDHLKAKKKEDVKEGMQLEDYERLFDTMPPGLEEVNIVGGGEPLVHRQCVGIMRAIKQRGLRGSLITNGSLMKPEIGAEMVDMGWDHVRVSVHAGDRETYNAIQGVDRFDIVRENIQAFHRARVDRGREAQCRLHVFHVIQHENIPSIERLFAFAEEVSADFIEFEKIIPYDDAKWLTPEELQLARDRIAECASRCRIPSNCDVAIGQLSAEKKSVESENRRWVPAKRCSVGFDQAFIDSFGKVTPCCFSDEEMGNVREQSFADIWKSPAYSKFRTDLIQGRFRKYCITNRCHLPSVLHN